MTDRSSRRSYHFVLLAENEQGYRHLTYLVSKAYLDGFYYHPRIDKALLRDHSEGLIGLSACLGGEVAQSLLNRGTAQCEETIREYKDLFAPGNYYLRNSAQRSRRPGRAQRDAHKAGAGSTTSVWSRPTTATTSTARTQWPTTV